MSRQKPDGCVNSAVPGGSKYIVEGECVKFPQKDGTFQFFHPNCFVCRGGGSCKKILTQDGSYCDWNGEPLCDACYVVKRQASDNSGAHAAPAPAPAPAATAMDDEGEF